MRTLPSCDEVEALRTRRQTPPLGRDADHAAALLLPPFVASALMLSLSRTLRAALPRASVPSASRRCLASVSRLQQQLPADAAVGRPPVHDFQWLLSTEPPVPAAEKPAQDEGPEPATRPAKIRTERLRFDYLNRSMNEKGTCAVDRTDLFRRSPAELPPSRSPSCSAIRQLCVAHGVKPVRYGTIVELPGAGKKRNRRTKVDCASVAEADQLRESLERARKAQTTTLASINFKRVEQAKPSDELVLSGIPSNTTEQCAFLGCWA
jgi:hypothetical protein